MRRNFSARRSPWKDGIFGFRTAGKATSTFRAARCRRPIRLDQEFFIREAFGALPPALANQLKDKKQNHTG